MAKITIFVPDHEPARYGLGDEEQVTIGRSPDCDIIVEHSSVSSLHAYIRRIGAGLHVLVDNGSTNGIFLEGEQVSEAPLSNGASFQIGSVPAAFEADGAEATEQPAAAEEPAAGAGIGESTGGSYGAPVAPIAESSARPAGFRDLSPIEKIEKKDSMAQIAMIIGVIGIIAAIGLVMMTVMMKVEI